MDYTTKNNLRTYAAGFVTAATFGGILFLIREWGATTWLIRVIYSFSIWSGIY